MSAKWRRRKKDLRRVNLLRRFTRTKGRNTLQSTKNTRVTREINEHVHLKNRKFPNFRLRGKLKDPEPLVDILEEESQIVIVAEFAGFDRDDLKIHARNQRLTLTAMSSGRRYYKSLNLPKRVIPNAIRTTFRNGVLEIQLRKATDNTDSGQSSWIEHAN